jgi:hypothetical protein
MIGLAKYSKIKDHYCLAYFGPNEEYLFQMRLFKPLIEKKFPGLKISFACRDEFFQVFSSEDSVVKVTELKSKRDDFAHVREISFNGKTHPIEDLLSDCGIEDYQLEKRTIEHPTVKAVVISKTHYPAKNLNEQQINNLKKIAKQMGYEPEVDTEVSHAGLVLGVESKKLFEAAYQGAKVILVPTGVGTRLYSKSFPQIEISVYQSLS